MAQSAEATLLNSCGIRLTSYHGSHTHAFCVWYGSDHGDGDGDGVVIARVIARAMAMAMAMASAMVTVMAMAMVIGMIMVMVMAWRCIHVKQVNKHASSSASEAGSPPARQDSRLEAFLKSKSTHQGGYHLAFCSSPVACSYRSIWSAADQCLEVLPGWQRKP